MLERASIADAPRLEPVSRRLELVNTGLEPANLGTFSARQLSDAAISLAPNIQSTLALQERTDRQALEEGIDRVRVSRRDHVGPHLLTTRKALDIEKAGRAFLAAASGTASRLHIAKASIGREFARNRIMLPDRLPPLFRCPYRRSTWPTCDRSSKYRTADGSCNNLDNPLWGRSQTPFERFEEPDYDDGMSSPRTRSSSSGTLPNAREISREFHTNVMNALPDLNHLAMEYGQFISHDIQFNALSRGYGGSNLDCCARPNRHGCFPIDIPPNDPFFPANRTCMNFVRALPTPNLECTIGVREQLNQNTHFHDASQVYGSDKEAADSLREFRDGLMKTSTSDDLLPTATGDNAGCISTDVNRACFRAGDVRVNQQPALASLQTIWLREHNRLARRLAQVKPAWRGDDETLYQEARRIVIAEMQHITYSEYLSEILGSTIVNRYDLAPRATGYFNGYNSREKPMIRNAFSAAAFRFGHSMIYHRILTHSGVSQTSSQLLKETFLRPDLLYTRGVGEITRGLIKSPSETVDKYVTEQVTRHLFERQPGFGGDLAAINIQRGRDHGIPNYQVWRRHCGLSGQYSHSFRIRRQLRNIYRSPNDMDLFTAGVSETPVAGGKVGPTFACIIGQQFESLKKGDRFYYENSGSTSFTAAQLAAIRQVTLANVICRNTDIDRIQRQALRKVMPGNSLVNCRYIEDIDLSAWGPGGSGCTPVHGGWSDWQRTPCFGGWRLRYRLCNNPSPNECGRPCSAPYQFEVDFCTFQWFQPNRRMSAPLARKSVAGPASAATQATQAEQSAMVSQVEKALVGLVGGKGGTSIDPSVFEKALSSVSSTGNRPRTADVRSPFRQLQPRTSIRNTRLMRAI